MDSRDSEFETEYQAWLAGQPEGKRHAWFDRPVRALAREAVCLVNADTRVADAVRLMAKHETGTALVRDEGERVVGIFTERDLLHRVVSEGRDPEATRVDSVMTRDPEMLSERASVAQAIRLLARASYRHLPLVEDSGAPVAVLSARHLMGFIGETFPKEVLNAPPTGSRPIQQPEGA